jgi:hypothetical protein
MQPALHKDDSTLVGARRKWAKLEREEDRGGLLGGVKGGLKGGPKGGLKGGAPKSGVRSEDL